MQSLIVSGGKKLQGEVPLQGAKNSALPIMAAAYLCEGECILHNCPKLTDIYAASRILNYIGKKCCFSGNTVIISRENCGGSCRNCIPENYTQEMRSSIIFLGALLGKHKSCVMSYPGGCELGPRPIDMHLTGLRKMGVDIREEHGHIICNVPKCIHGAKISLNFPSVGTTENIMIAAVLAEGETIINNAAREPEICDLADFLRSCGAKIKGDGESRIIIQGVEKLCGCEYTIMPDRIAGATYLAAVAGTGGEIVLQNACISHIEPFLSYLEQTGCSIYTPDNDKIFLRSGAKLKAIKNCVRTMPHPGFPTDAQAILMAALAKSDGVTVFEENIFGCRYRHIDALMKLGADIRTSGKTAVINGVPQLYGATVEATDLRSGAAMVIAALMAEGDSEITEICHIDRGYEDIEFYFQKLGADIKRV